VVVLEIHLDERLPVVVALVQLDLVQHVAAEVEVGLGAEWARSAAMSRPLSSNTMPFHERTG
jgi:hypothetical protein